MKRQVTQSNPKGLEIWFSKWGWYFGPEAKHGTDGTFHIYIQQNLSLAEVTYFPDVQCSVSTYCMLLEKVFLGALLIQEVFHPFCFSFIKSGEICGNITPTPSSWTKTRLSSLETHFLSQTWGKSSKISPSSESAPVCRIWFVFHKKSKTNTLCFSPFTQLCFTTRRKAKTHWISHKCNTRYRNNKVSTFLNFWTPHVHCTTCNLWMSETNLCHNMTTIKKSDKYASLLVNEGNLMKMHWWRTGRMTLSQVAIVTNSLALALEGHPHKDN